VALVVEDILKLAFKNERNRWLALLATVLVVVTSVKSFQGSPYFGDRVSWTLGVRRVSAVTATDASKLLSGITPDSWLFIYSAKDTPWLLIPGPCDFLNVLERRPSFNCVLGGSLDETQKRYEAHEGPKYYLTYNNDGSLRVTNVTSALVRQPVQQSHPIPDLGSLTHLTLASTP